MTIIIEPTVMAAEGVSPTVAPIKNVALEATSELNTVNTDVLNESEFTRSAVEALGTHVRLVDNDEASGLDLFCYVRCGPTDEGLIRQCRGVVFHKNEIVMKAFPYTVEYSVADIEKIEETIKSVWSDCTFYDAHEGALIRMFNFGGKWFTSTHRKLNAFRSKWASRESFGTSFKKALESEVENNAELRVALPDGEEGLLERFQSTLNPNKQYMFLVRNSGENRIVCAAPVRDTLYHVGTFVDGELTMDEDIHIPHPTRHRFVDLNDMFSYVERLNPAQLQGVIVFAPDNKQYKIFHKEYLELFRARGNEPSIKFRYLQVRMNRKQTAMLYYLYPDMEPVFNDYENAIFDISKGIYRSYVNRFIKKNYVTVPVQEFSVIRECHSWHLEDREANRINQNKIIDILNKQSPTSINQMIRRLRSEQDRRTDAKEVGTQRTRSNTIGQSVENSPVISGNTPVVTPLLLTKTLANLPPLPPPAVSEKRRGPRVLSKKQK